MELTRNYIFHPTGQCYLSPDQKELKLASRHSNKWQYQNEESILTITKIDKKTITARLYARHNPGSIYSWEDADPGRAVYDPEKSAYVLKFGLPKIFHLTNDKYQKQKP